MSVYHEIFEVIKERKKQFECGTAAENSYTCYLFEKGVDKICKKVGEEATETVIACKDGKHDEIVGEVADLIYHLTVELQVKGVSWNDVFDELKKR